MGLIYMVIAFYVAWLGMAVATMGDKLLEFLPLLLLVGVLLPLTGMHFVPEAFGALVALAERWSKAYGKETVRSVGGSGERRDVCVHGRPGGGGDE